VEGTESFTVPFFKNLTMENSGKVQKLANEIDFRIKLAKATTETSKRPQFFKGKVEAFESVLSYISIHFNIRPDGK